MKGNTRWPCPSPCSYAWVRASLETLRRENYFRWAELVQAARKKGSRVCLDIRTLIKHTANSDQARIVLRSSCDRVSRGNESIPSPRHRVETAPKEQSIWLTCVTSLVRRS